MGKKRTGQKRSAVAGRAPKAAARKTTKYVDFLLQMSREERSAFLERASAEELVKVFEQSYASDLVNILLDLKKSSVKHILETVAAFRKRAMVEPAVLYHYKEYLTNPLPLRLESESGLSIPNFYAILGVSRDASEDDLKNAFRLLERAHDPEVFSPAMRKSGEERLREIQDAYNNLKSPQKRTRADRLLPNISYLYPRRDQSWFEAVSRILA